MQNFFLLTLFFFFLKKNWCSELTIGTPQKIEEAETDYFGFDLSIEGGKAVIGQTSKSGNWDNPSSKFFIYGLNKESGLWEKKESKTRKSSRYLGYSVKMKSNLLVVADRGGNVQRGEAYLYQFNSSTEKYDEISVFNDCSDSNCVFGSAFALNEEFLMIGGKQEDYNSYSNTGSVRIYKKNDDNQWIFRKKLLPTTKETNLLFGNGVVFQDSYVLISAHNEDVYASSSGAVYSFKNEKIGEVDNWVDHQKIVPPEGFIGDKFGVSIQMVPFLDSYLAAIGMPGMVNVNHGHVFLYKLNTQNDKWELYHDLIQPDQPNLLSEHTNFGYKIALTSQFLVVNAYDTEEVYVFKIGNFSNYKKIVNPEGGIGDRFGNSLAIDDENLFVSSIHHNEQKGAVYTYTIKSCQLECENDGYANPSCSECVCRNFWDSSSNCSECARYCPIGTPDSNCQSCVGDEIYCFGIATSDESHVCSGHGECKSFNYCECQEFYEGKDCSEYDAPETTNNNIVWILVPVILVSLIVFCIIVVVFVIVTVVLSKKANRFNHIKDIEMIAKEAELEQQENKTNPTPKFKISKSSIIIDSKEIELKKVIGEGGSETCVYLADWKGQKIAYKSFQSSQSIMDSENSFEDFEKELDVCVNVNHPNILQFYGACINPPKIGLLLEYCTFGDIPSFLANKEKYPVSEKLRILWEITSGMIYLHSRKFIHRDIKPENILIDDNEHAKIMDFGLSKLRENAEKTMTSKVGTCFYMAPEVIKGGKYSFPADVFSFAMLAFVFITENFTPFGIGINETVVMNKVLKNPEYRPRIDDNKFKECKFLIKLIQKNWSYDPKERNTFEEIQNEIKKHINNK